MADAVAWWWAHGREKKLTVAEDEMPGCCSPCYARSPVRDVEHMMHLFITFTVYFEFNPRVVHLEFMRIEQYAREVSANAWWGLPWTTRPLL